MGVEWDIGCLTCREYAWLGSLKPTKWAGFQLGNELLADLLALHANPACVLLLDVDHASGLWTRSDEGSDGWREDLRSLWFGDSDAGVCATCNARLDEAAAVIANPCLWFCNTSCVARFVARGARVWQPAPAAVAGLWVRCTRCDVETSVGESFEDLAYWLAEHIGCRLVAVRA
jgi:hypothetical protein